MIQVQPVILQGVNHYFGSGALRKQILFGIDLKLSAGEIVILTGPSGSGKTTLLTLIGALRTVQEGSVQVLGTELCGAGKRLLIQARRRLGFIFQAHNLHRSLTALQNVQMGLEVHGQVPHQFMKDKALEMLEAVGLGGHATKLPDQLSGGQKQRVAIARALVSHPKLILADEPTAALDKNSGREVVDLLKRLAVENGTTILMVTHDNRILDTADRIVQMEDGRLIQTTLKSTAPVTV
jgi:putative ABC transport system ATP-binding protein